VLSLIGGAIAAWVVSYRETKVRRSEMEQREKEERTGLLILVRQEIASNQWETGILKDEKFHALKKMSAGVYSVYTDAVPAAALKTATWESTKVRLAQLIPANKLDTLLSYYSTVQTIRLLLQIYTDDKVVEATGGDVGDELSKLASVVLDKGEQAQTVADSLINESAPRA